jgi:hypothetical protein
VRTRPPDTPNQLPSITDRPLINRLSKGDEEARPCEPAYSLAAAPLE